METGGKIEGSMYMCVGLVKVGKEKGVVEKGGAGINGNE